jgi:hypothetical protein
MNAAVLYNEKLELPFNTKLPDILNNDADKRFNNTSWKSPGSALYSIRAFINYTQAALNTTETVFTLSIKQKDYMSGGVTKAAVSNCRLCPDNMASDDFCEVSYVGYIEEDSLITIEVEVKIDGRALVITTGAIEIYLL